MQTVKVEREYPDEELMDAVFDNIFKSTSPWVVQYAYGGFDEDPVVPIAYYNYNDELVNERLSAADLACGLQILLSGNYYHCGSKVDPDMETWDACVSDMILQAALMGDVIYG